MKSLTPKQRGEIYLKVAIRLCAGRYLLKSDIFLCNQLKNVAKLNHWKDSEEQFPEFALFKNEHRQLGWWENGEKEPRIMCMLICYEMTKTQKQ